MTPYPFPRDPTIIPSSRLLFTQLSPSELAAAVPRGSSAIPGSGAKLKETPEGVVVVRGDMALSRFVHPETGAKVVLYCVDELHRYPAFYRDFGPFNINNFYKFSLALHSVLEDPRLKDMAICVHTAPVPEMKANIACMLACYTLIVEKRMPWEAYQPFAQLEIMPFRDAARAPADWGMTIQDVLWGLWRANEMKLLSLADFDSAEYETFETVENGDFNILGPFIAFASPKDVGYIAKPRGGTTEINTAFANVLRYFKMYGVKTVVRLNEKLYDKRQFEKLGMRHVDMWFEDGSNPSEEMVRAFIKLADATISKGGKVAVHCKAGLGRSGCLIGAYLVYKYGFSAAEVIAYMRIIRPGMIVGPQQAYLANNFMEWIKWSAVDEVEAARRVVGKKGSKTSVITIEDEADEAGMITPTKLARSVNQAATGIKTPGQPRKTPSKLSKDPMDSSTKPLPPLSPLKFDSLHRSRPRSDSMEVKSTNSTEPIGPPTKKRLTTTRIPGPSSKGTSSIGTTTSSASVLSSPSRPPTPGRNYRTSASAIAGPESPSPTRTSRSGTLPKRGALRGLTGLASGSSPKSLGFRMFGLGSSSPKGENEGGKKEKRRRD